MFKRVEVTFANQQGLVEVAQGRLISWHSGYAGDGWTEVYIALDDTRMVLGTGTNYEKVTFRETLYSSGSDVEEIIAMCEDIKLIE